jgi:hypothetical protein
MSFRSEDRELCYLAGLFDGEGCITISLAKGKKRRQPMHLLVCALAMTDEAAVRAYHEKFGGQFDGPVKRPRRQPQWRWRVSANDALKFIKTLQPYLRVKAAQARVGVEFQEDKPRTLICTLNELNRREGLRQKIHSLNGNKRIKRGKFEPDKTLLAESKAQRDRFRRYLRLKKKNKSPKEIAEALGVSRVLIYHYNRGIIPNYARDLV